MATDVLIVGGGIFGLSCAWACVQRGLAVRLVEADRIGSGASGGIVGALSPHVPDQWNPKKQYQFDALCMADAYWTAVERISGMSAGYARTGRLMPLTSAEARALAESRIADAGDNWGCAGEWCVVDGGAYSDWLAPSSAPFGIVRDTLSARLDPAAAVQALGAACALAGVEIVEGERAVSVGPGQIRTGSGTVLAGAVILASGVAGFDLLAPVLGQAPGQGVKGQAARVDASVDPGMPTIYADGVYIVPHSDGTVAVGSTSENRYEAPVSTDDQLDDLVVRARAICPAIADAPVIQRWAGVRPKARRRDPMLGPVPGAPGLFAALGGFKIGFGIAPKVGETLADMVTGAAADLPGSFRVEHHL